MKHIIATTFAVITAALLAGCASGPLYRDIKTSGSLTPHKGNGMVLIYWKPSAAGSGYAGAYLFANNVRLPSRLPRGGFISYEAAPGPLKISLAAKTNEATATTQTVAALSGGAMGLLADNNDRHRYGLDINLLPDQTYYLEMRAGFWHGLLDQVPKEKGEKDIQQCHWENAPSSR